MLSFLNSTPQIPRDDSSIESLDTDFLSSLEDLPPLPGLEEGALSHDVIEMEIDEQASFCLPWRVKPQHSPFESSADQELQEISDSMIRLVTSQTDCFRSSENGIGRATVSPVTIAATEGADNDDSSSSSSSHQTSESLSSSQERSLCTAGSAETVAKPPTKTSKVSAQTKQYAVVCQLDVLLGRGQRYNVHTGNMRFRKAKECFSKAYLATSSIRTKTAIAQTLVDTVGEWGGRFLSEDESGCWYIVDNKTARSKASQALRDSKLSKAQLKQKRMHYRKRKEASSPSFGTPDHI